MRGPSMLLAFCLVPVTALVTGPPATAARKWRDEEVFASQAFFTSEWRDKYNKGELAFCKDSYVRDAALRVTLGPAREDLARVAGFAASPLVLRGKEEVAGFWTALSSVTQLQGNLFRCQEEGPYTCERFALDDDHVLISGKLAFGDVLIGQAVSQTWRRIGDEDLAGSVWKIESEMIDFTELHSALGGASPPRPVLPLAPEASEAPLAPQLPEAQDLPAEAEPRRQPTQAPAVVDGPASGMGAEPTEAPPEPESGGQVKTVALFAVAVGFAFYLYRRNNMKQEMSRSVEAKAMLG